MLHYQHRIAAISQVFQCLDQSLVIALVQAYAGLVQYIGDACELRTYLCGQSDALRFAATQCACRPVQCQVVQPHIQQEVQPVSYFFDYVLGNRFLFVVQAVFNICKPPHQLLQRKLRYFRYVLAIHFKVQALFF